LSEFEIKELIVAHCEKIEANFKATIQINNENVEDRIDDILVQI